jgi:hypothetical protein
MKRFRVTLDVEVKEDTFATVYERAPTEKALKRIILHAISSPALVIVTSDVIEQGGVAPYNGPKR